MSNDVYMIQLKSVKVVENGKIEEEVEGANILEAKLIYPKEGIPALTSLRDMKLEDGTPKDYSKEPMKERVLFKQSFDGETELEFNICAEVRNIAIEKVFFKLLGIVTKETLKTIPGLGSVATAAITSFTESIFSFTPNRTEIIGSVSIPMPKGFTCQNKKFEFKVPKDVEIVKMRKKYPSNEIVFDKLKLKKDQLNGEIVIDIVKL